MQSTVYLLQQELKEAKERINRQLVELDELRLVQSNGNSHPLGNGLVDTLERTDGIVELKNLVINSSHKEDTRCFNKSSPVARDKQAPMESCSKQSTDSMDIEADSTTGLMSASCRNHSDHCRTKPPNSDKLGSNSDESNGKKSTYDRCKNSSTKMANIESSDCLPNGVVVRHD